MIETHSITRREFQHTHDHHHNVIRRREVDPEKKSEEMTLVLEANAWVSDMASSGLPTVRYPRAMI